MIDNISCDGKLLAIILRKDFNKPGIHFFTPDDFSQQLAYMIEALLHTVGFEILLCEEFMSGKLPGSDTWGVIGGCRAV